MAQGGADLELAKGWRRKGRCYYCGRALLPGVDRRHPLSPTIDHKEPLSGDHPDRHKSRNLVRCCQECNRRKADRDIREFVLADWERFGRDRQLYFRKAYGLTGRV